MQINKIENKCTIVKTNKTKSCFFRKINPTQIEGKKKKERNDAHYQIAGENYVP